LAEQVDAGTIRIIDCAFVIKDEDGQTAAMEVSDLDSEAGAAFAKILGNERGGILNQEDLMAAAEELDVDSSAALLVWEDLWATKIRDAMVAAGGELWDLERVPYDVVQAAVEYAESV
jgi:hypothetical protein